MNDEHLICKAPLMYLETDKLTECAICHKKKGSSRIDREMIHQTAALGCNFLLVPPYCIHIISSAPEMAIPIFVLQIRMSVEYHQ